MADDRIRISWDDVRSPAIDAQMRQQSALAQAQQHVASQPPVPYGMHLPAGHQRRGLIYNTVVYLGLFGLLGGQFGWSIGEVIWSTYPQASWNYSVVPTLLFTASIAVLLATFLSIAEQVVARNWRGAIINGSTGIIFGLFGGIVVALFINKFYTWMLGADPDIAFSRQILARGIGWAVLGVFVSIAPGIVLRNAKRLVIGLTGGFLGGLLGGLLFDPIVLATGSDRVSRWVGISSIGVLAGVATGLIEHAAKAGWLRVSVGLLAGKQFVLYRNPTYVGSSPQCEIYLFKDVHIAPRHAAIRTVAGGFEIEDLRTSTGTFVNGQAVSRIRLRNNDQVQIGSTTFSFQEKAKP